MASYKTIRVIGGNLHALALQHLGDATQWNRIAELNLTGPSPILPTGQAFTLRIPSVNLAAGGGIYKPPRNNNPHVDTLLTNAAGDVLTGKADIPFRRT